MLKYHKSALGHAACSTEKPRESEIADMQKQLQLAGQNREKDVKAGKEMKRRVADFNFKKLDATHPPRNLNKFPRSF